MTNNYEKVIQLTMINMKSSQFVIILWITLFVLACAKPNKESAVLVSSGYVERITDFPSEYIANRNVDIWLPENYSKSKKYAVLYMHDGQMLFDSTETWNKQEWGVDEMITFLVEKGKIKETIVVGVWNSGNTRHADYYPQKAFEALSEKFKKELMETERDENTALFARGVQSDNYLKFLVSELKPYIDKNYSTKSGRDDTAIMGSSMGGLISVYALCEYPDIFVGAACLSTHWIGGFNLVNNPMPESFYNYLNKNLPDPQNHKIYFDYGTKTLDALYEPYQTKVDSVMKLKLYNSENWQTQKFEGADHSEDSWKQRLDIPLLFLLKKSE